jgi:Asp-tRNA(Asn)/Glu-tRNA(Gln) amidotransferase A subunit family amidase
MNLFQLTATEAARQIRKGEITSEELVKSCLNRIKEIDDTVHAWVHLDPKYALEQARLLDSQRSSGGPVGPLHGIPVGIKDIFNTKNLPTENGTILDTGRQPQNNCKVVDMLMEAGAIIIGKTVTTELAVFAPGKTLNPHDPKRTPGGSSSGSAAAVSAFMVPLAIGTQTNGSMIRPASYCGVIGFKPTHGLIPRTGVLKTSSPLDTIGTFARSLEDIALISETLVGYDSGDKYTSARAQPAFSETLLIEPPITPMVGFAKTHVWDEADDTTKQAFEELAGVLGDDCRDLPLSDPFKHLIEMHSNIMYADIAINYADYYERGKNQLSDTLCQMIECGQEISAVDYNSAIIGQETLNSGLDACFEHYDIIITPAAPGEASEGLAGTGSPVFNTLATYCGVPSISLPLMEGPNGLPLGVQVIGPRGDDARLLRNANWLINRVQK